MDLSDRRSHDICATNCFNTIIIYVATMLTLSSKRVWNDNNINFEQFQDCVATPAAELPIRQHPFMKTIAILTATKPGVPDTWKAQP